MFGTFKLVRNAIKSKFIFNSWGKEFVGEDSQSFDNYFAKNLLIFGVDNSSSYHADNWKSNFLAFDTGPTDNDTTGSAEKIGLPFKADTKFCVSSNCNGDESYLYANKTEICKLKAKDNLSWYNFSLGSISKDCLKNEHTLIFQLVIFT